MLTGSGARVRHLAGFWPHDQIDVAGSHPSLGVGEALVLVRQRPDRLAGDLERFGADGQFTALGSDHFAFTPT